MEPPARLPPAHSVLPAGYIKEVVTDDQGRYLIPSLPPATYTVWARGYGLLGSPKIRTRPGKQVNLKPFVALNQRAAAHYYPGNYWYAMKVPIALDGTHWLSATRSRVWRSDPERCQVGCECPVSYSRRGKENRAFGV